MFEPKTTLLILEALTVPAAILAVVTIVKSHNQHKLKKEKEKEEKKRITSFLKEKGGRYVSNITHLGHLGYFQRYRDKNNDSFVVFGSLGCCCVDAVFYDDTGL